MATACRVGGMVSNVSADTLDALTQFGHHLGMCFQVVDDVLDVTAHRSRARQARGNDVHEGVYTLPVIYALADDGICATCSGASSTTASPRRRPRDRAAANGSVDASLAVARDHAAKAAEALSGRRRPRPDVTAGLRRLVEGLVDRSS